MLNKFLFIPSALRTCALPTPPSISDSHFPNVDAILENARQFEKKGKLREAENLYKKIIFDLNSKEKRAYDSLVRLWGHTSVFGFTTERVESLLEQYEKNFPKSDSTDDLKSRLKK